MKQDEGPETSVHSSHAPCSSLLPPGLYPTQPVLIHMTLFCHRVPLAMHSMMSQMRVSFSHNWNYGATVV